ncbi:hypothetical protein BJ742DRAFT_881735 [Cladochytrium replicatum]|nr:hypothetical protein BJ742DRAFT_881735 [Cladochytrium replicatum]
MRLSANVASRFKSARLHYAWAIVIKRASNDTDDKSEMSIVAESFMKEAEEKYPTSELQKAIERACSDAYAFCSSIAWRRWPIFAQNIACTHEPTAFSEKRMSEELLLSDLKAEIVYETAMQSSIYDESGSIVRWSSPSPAVAGSPASNFKAAAFSYARCLVAERNEAETAEELFHRVHRSPRYRYVHTAAGEFNEEERYHGREHLAHLLMVLKMEAMERVEAERDHPLGPLIGIILQHGCPAI